MNRRDFMVATGLTGTAAAALGQTTTDIAVNASPPPRIGSLLNRERASAILRKANLDGMVVNAPLNVYYTTNAVPVLSRFSEVSTAVAIVPTDPARPIAYVSGAFEYYAGVTDSGLAAGVEPYLVGGTLTEPNSTASPAFERVGTYSFDARETHRRALLEKAAPFYETMAKAVAKAVSDRGLNRGRLGVDSSDARRILSRATPGLITRAADHLMLHIRLVKTPAELELMRRASANNVEAALAAANAAREERTVWGVRQRFFREAALRGNIGVYGSVDLVMSELADGSFREGQAFMIDFVSHYGFYQGDYGRTVFFGDADPQMRRAAEVGAIAWHEIREKLRPGLAFSEVHEIGERTVKKLNERFTYAFNPHSVGLQHWDQPRVTIDGKPLDLTLEEGMVLSVDCPLLNAGVNGTTHIEDLTVITERGSERLHRDTEATMQV